MLIVDTTTYDNACVKTSRDKYKHTLDNNYPWLMFIVIVKYNDIENCLLKNLNGKPYS